MERDERIAECREIEDSRIRLGLSNPGGDGGAQFTWELDIEDIESVPTMIFEGSRRLDRTGHSRDLVAGGAERTCDMQIGRFFIDD